MNNSKHPEFFLFLQFGQQSLQFMFLFILINLKLLSFLAIHQKEENTVYCIFSKLNVKFHNRATFYQKKDQKINARRKKINFY